MALPASDFFASADGTTITAHSAAWNNATGQIVINNERINGNTASWNLATAYWIADLFNSNQYSQAIFYHNNGSGSNSTGVGCNLQGTIQGYTFMSNFSGSNLIRINNAGDSTVLSSAAGVPNGATIRIENVDGLITCYINGSTAGAPAAVQDNTFTGGAAGVVFQQNGTYAQLDNWVGGNVISGPSTGLPVYETDLVDITTADSTTNWVALAGGAGALATSTALAMQSGICIGRAIDGEGGSIYNPASAITIPASYHILLWSFVASPGITVNMADRGVCAIIGGDSANHVKYHLDGKDTYGAGGRVGKCYAIDYSVRTNNNTAYPYRTLVGTAPENPNYLGASLSLSVPNTSINLGVDAIRMGTGLFVTGGEAATPATFQGIADVNDGLFARWGLLTGLSGGFELQGKLALGQNPSQVATAVHFEDSDKSVVIIDCQHAASNFTAIIVDHADSFCKLTNIAITSLGVNNKGSFTVTTADPTVEINSGVWANLGVITLQSNSTVTNTVFRNCETMAVNAATLDKVTVDKSASTVALTCSTLSNLTSCVFVSAGTGHAVNLGTITASGSMLWSSTDTGYTDASSGNETILVSVAAGQTLTINVAAGATTPSVYNTGAGSVVITAAGGSIKFTLSTLPTPDYEWRLYSVTAIGSLAGSVELAGAENETVISPPIYNHQFTNQPAAIQILSSDYEEVITYVTLNSSAQTPLIFLTVDDND